MKIRPAISLLVLSVLLVTASPLHAYWEEGGVSPTLSPVTAVDPMAIADGEGGVVIVWRDMVGSGPGGQGIYAQRVDKEGTYLWGDYGTQITGETPAEEAPRIVPSADGWLVAWCDVRNGVSSLFAAWIDGSGVVQSEVPTMESQLFDQTDFRMIQMDEDDIFVDEDAAIIVWRGLSDDSPSLPAVHAQRLQVEYGEVETDWNDDGELVESSEGGYLPRIVPDDKTGPGRRAMIFWKTFDGDVYATWVEDTGSGPGAWPVISNVVGDYEAITCPDGALVVAERGSEVVVQRIDTDGTTYWNDPGEFGETLCLFCPTIQTEPTITIDSDGNAVIAYLRAYLPGEEEVWAQKIDPTQNTLTRIWWNQRGMLVEESSPATESHTPQIVSNSTGGTVVTWYDSGSSRVYVQSLDSNGDRFWPQDVSLDAFCGGCPPPQFDIVEETGGGSYVAWTGNELRTSRVTRVTDVQFGSQYAPASYRWHANVSFINVSEDVTESDSARASHGTSLPSHDPSLPWECRYSRAEVKNTVEGNRMYVWLGSLPATLAHCYRLIPGGLPAYEGSEPLLLGEPRPVHLGFENSEVEDENCEPFQFPFDRDGECPPGACFSVSEGQSNFHGHLQGNLDRDPPLAQPPHLTTRARRMGAYALEFDMPAQLQGEEPACGWPNQRSELVAEKSQPFYEEKWDAFSIMIPEDSEIPEEDATKTTILMQYYCQLDVGPTMVLTLETVLGEMKLFWFWEHEDRYVLPTDWGCTVGDQEPREIGTISKGEWVDLIVNYKFDPTGEHVDPETGEVGGFWRVWMNPTSLNDEPTKKYPTTEEYPGKLGVPEEFVGECVPLTDLNDEHLWQQKFGIYRTAKKRNVKVIFDEMKLGAETSEDLDLTFVRVNRDEITSLDYVPGTGDWQATLIFETSPSGPATVTWGPATGCDGSFAPAHSYESPAGADHTVVLSGLSLSAYDPDYCYQIEAEDSQGETTIIEGRITLQSLFDISHSYDPASRTVDVDWKTPLSSENNVLHHRAVGTSTWSTVQATRGSCKRVENYSASFLQPRQREFKISTTIDGETIESQVLQSGASTPDPRFTSTPQINEVALRIHPNPFNPTTTVTYDVPSESRVEIVIFSADGSRVTTLESRDRSMGRYSVDWNGRNDSGRPMASGIYFVRLSVGATVLTSKMVLLK